MQDLELTILISVQIQVKIFRPLHGGRVEILINNFREGTMEKNGGIWSAVLKPGSQLTGADISIIGDMLDDQEALSNDNLPGNS
jgi:hypothetical protein